MSRAQIARKGKFIVRNDSQYVEVDAWTNGAKAEVRHLRNASGDSFIEKKYRAAYLLTFLRELCALKYLSCKTNCVPKIQAVDLFRLTTYIEFVAGERVLEWVLRRFGPEHLVIDSFKSFHGLESNEDVAIAFENLRNSSSPDAESLKIAIAASYEQIHKLRLLHGDPSPRNLIFDGNTIFVIDFDHARPSLSSREIDGKKLLRWYGIVA